MKFLEAYLAGKWWKLQALSEARSLCPCMHLNQTQPSAFERSPLASLVPMPEEANKVPLI